MESMETREKWEIRQRPIKELQEISWHLARQVLQLSSEAKAGDPANSLSSIDILTALYLGEVLRHDPQHPGWEERDRFISSRGHALAGLYITLAEAGYFDPALIPALLEAGRSTGEQPSLLSLPGMDAATGSLLQGLAFGLGQAMVASAAEKDWRVYVLLGERESDHELVLAVAQAIASNQLNNLTAIFDLNQIQETQATTQEQQDLAVQWRQEGWQVIEINGHDLGRLMESFKLARSITDRPQLIMAHTLKGKGLTPFEDKRAGDVLTADELETALAELDDLKYTVAHGTRDPLEWDEVTPEEKFGEI